MYGVNKDLRSNMHILLISARLVFFSFYTSVYERKYLDASCIGLLAPNFDKFVITTLPVHLKLLSFNITGCASLDAYGCHIT